MRYWSRILVAIGGIFFLSYGVAYAHEAYVLPYDTFWASVRGPLDAHAFTALKNPHNLIVTACIVVSVSLLLLANFLLRLTSFGRRVNAFFERFAHAGPHFVRITIAIALFFSAISGSFLGPELHTSLFPYPGVVTWVLLVASILIAVGFLTELAALAAVAVFVWGFFVFGSYMITYLNYLGELIVLLLFGMRAISVDRFIFGPLRRFRSFEKYETVIVRVFYGSALIFAGITVKLLHPDLTVEVVEDWHLTNFHWLFPSDPLLVTFGAGIVEMVIGFFIIVGFEMRMTVLISLFYITLSLLYFRELVWPHLLLYGISFNLILQPEVLTFDHFFFKKHSRIKVWWKRIFSAHTPHGKSTHETLRQSKS